jgi:hypothetical protein
LLSQRGASSTSWSLCMVGSNAMWSLLGSRTKRQMGQRQKAARTRGLLDIEFDSA